MKSIKPGRAPSFMGGIGSVVVGVIGVGWTVMASRMGAPGFFTLFGVGFVVLAVAGAVYQFKNATSKNRYSTFDITDGNEESDPLNDYFGGQRESVTFDEGGDTAYCPYCGARTDDGYRFCKKCGKRLPE
jgi:hypothetical protein